MGDRDFRVQRMIRAAALSGLLLLTAACDDDDAPPPPPTYTVGGAVSGLNGSVTLVNANGDARTVTANGSFTFGTPLRANTNYAVTVQTQPANQQCTVTNGSGAIASSNITNVVVACETIRVTATIGAAGGRLIGPDGVEVEIPALALSADTVIGIARSSVGAPTPPSSLMQLGPIYEFTPHDISFREPVKIRIPAPSAEATVLMAGVGEDFNAVNATITSGVAEISRATFSWGAIYGGCHPPGPGDDPYGCVAPRGGSALSSTPSNALISVHPQNPQARQYELHSAATIQFRLTYKAQADCLNNTSSVRVRRARVQPNGAVIQPPQTVAEQGAAMTLDEPGVCVGCWQTGQPSTVYTASGVTTLNVPHTYEDNGAWIYSMQFICTRRGVTRTYADAATINVDITPPVVTHSIGGSVSGLTGSGLVLQNNGADDLAINANGAFTFSREIGHGDSYNVTVRTQPSGQVCTVSNGGGTAQSAVTNIAVNCAAVTVRSWRAAQVLASEADHALSAPRVAFDAYGNATAAWLRYPGHEQAEIWVSAYRPGAGWTLPERVAEVTDGAIDDLNLAMPGAGEAVLVWEQRNQDHYNIYSTRRDDEGQWGEPTEIDALVNGARDPRLALNSAGAGFAVWMQGTPQGGDAVMAAPYSAAQGWGAPTRISGSDTDWLAVRIAVNASGEALALFSDGSLFAASYSAGAWSPTSAIDVNGAEYSSAEIDVALDDQGAGVAVYADSANTGAVYGNRRAGGIWGAQDVLKAGAWAPRRLKVAMRSNGAAIAAWVEGEVGHQVWTRAYGSLLGAPQNLGDNNGRYQDLDLAFDADGSALLVWAHRFDQGVLASRCTISTDCTWSTPVQAASNPDGGGVQLAISPLGSAVVVYETDEESDTIEASVYE